MSKKQGLIAGLVGILGGAVVGSQYLNDTGQCVDNYGTVPQCALNEAIGPFVSAIAIGVCVAMLVGHLIYLFVHRILDPAPRSKPESPEASDVDDPSLQIAAWNMTPRVQAKAARVRIGTRADRRGAVDPHRPDPILEEDPRVRPESRVGSIGTRDRPIPSPRRLA